MIKKIYCFGTSHTRGGGFHEKRIKDIYKNIVDEPSMDTLSWPGLLQVLVGKKIKVENLAECGAGNERMYRLFWEIVSSDGFNKDEVLFLLEPSSFDRKEFWSNTINDYVICNYSANNPAHTVNFDVVKEYYRDYATNIDKKVYWDFLQETVRFEDILQRIQMNLIFFFNFLESNKFNYKIVHHYNLFKPEQQQYNVYDSVEYDINGIKTLSYYSTADTEGYTIRDETDNIIHDPHQGYFINNIVAKTINNILVNDNLINGKILQIENKHEDYLKLKQKLNLSRNLI